MTLTGHNGEVRSLAVYKKDGMTYLASASQDGTIKLWNVNDGSVVETLTGHSNEITLTAFMQGDMPALGSGDDSSTVKFWNLSSNELVKTFDGLTGPVSTLAFFNHTNKPNMAIATGNTIELWE